MAYTSKITYSIYDLNSSLFLELIREILQAEFVNQRTNHAKTFLPTVVKNDEYLINSVSDTDINPAFCSVSRARFNNAENQYHGQSNENNIFVIGVLADGLSNLRKILDAAYIILNDMDIKNYIFNSKNTDGELLLADSGTYRVTSVLNEIDVSKTINDKNIIYGNLTLQAEIQEVVKFNTHTALSQSTTEHQLGPNEISLVQTINI